MTFREVADAFEKIEQESSRLVITRILAELLTHATGSEARDICYLSLGQLNPPYIGTQFAIAQETMLKVVAQCLSIDDDVLQKKAKEIGDLGKVIERGNWKVQESLTLAQVYKELEKIEKLHGTGSQEEKQQALVKLLMGVDVLSAKYIVRIILGKLRLGFSDMTLIDALSWMEAGDKSLRAVLEKAYNACADIGYIAQLLKDEGVAAIEQVSVVVGIPIRPASAERLPTAHAIVEKLGPCIAQPKLDGFRVQVHLDKTGKEPKIHFFSRHLKDMSFMFPDLVEAIQELKVDSLICEGEAIVFDRNTGNFLPFQETVKRKRKHGIAQAIQEFPLQLFLFDLLYINGETILTQTHKQRRKILESIIEKVKKESAVKVIEEASIKTGKELENYFIANIAAGLEGLVVKREDAVYQAGKRNFNWIKLKRQEGGHLDDTIDCVVLGYYAGQGKRAQFEIGAFLVGVYNAQEDHFETIAKVGTGLKDADWVTLKKRCDTHMVVNQPKNVICAKELVPDVWVAPEIVVVVRADEITMSPLHTAGKTDEKLGYALRFPRFIDYRDDKGADEATTIKEMDQLFTNQLMR